MRFLEVMRICMPDKKLEACVFLKHRRIACLLRDRKHANFLKMAE